MGKFIPSISHNYSTVDPSCEVIAKILQWLYGHVFLRKFSGTWPYRAIVLRIPILFPAAARGGHGIFFTTYLSHNYST